MSKGLTNQKKGELRLKALREFANSGRLAFCKNRYQIAEGVGFPPEQVGKAGYQWVQYNIRKGVLREQITGLTNYGTAEYEYQFIDPEENKKVVSRGIEEAVKEFPNLIKKVEEPTEEEKEQSKRKAEEMYRAMEEQYEKEKDEKPTSTIITIYRGDTTVAIENVSTELILKIIKSVVE